MTNKSFFEKASDRQEGGDHYKLKIQPFDFIMENKLNFFQGNIIKYVVRYLKKDQIKDLNKIIHYCQLEIDRLRKEWDK
jgi:hypothetical protein|tara:strand:+ start:829 stop:1065 length:237 start_codon:yes stop_codon:yes gene_type:complete